MTPWDLDDPETAWQYIPRAMQELEKKRHAVFEAVQVAKDGRKIPVEVNANICEFPDGTYIVSSVRDIARRKHAEEALRESEEKLRAIFNASPQAILLLDREGRVLDTNQQHADRLGMEREEMLGKCIWDILPQSVRAHRKRQVERVFEAGTPFSGEDQRDGLWNEYYIYPAITNQAGEVTAVLVEAVDITARKQTEAALRESEEKYRVLVENATDAIYVAQDGRIRFHNSRTAEMTGRSGEDLIDRPFADFIHPEDREMVLDRHRRRLAGEDPPSTYTFRILGKTGAVLCVELNTVRISWENRPATLNFIRDVTEQKRLEEQLQQAQKMEAIGTLAGGIAHDFNNILSSVMGYTELSLEQAEKDSPLHSNLSQVMAAGMRARNLVKQILTVSRKDAPRKKPLPLAPLVREALKMLRSTIPSSIELEEQVEDGELVVHADPTQIHQVLMNLATNALHAMTDMEGRLAVSIRKARFDPAETGDLQPDIPPGDYARLAVSDTGVGISESHLEKIFEPYYTTKEKGRGTGLGLAVVHGIVKSHNGHISVASRPGAGTCVSIHLPLAGSPAGKQSAEQDRALPTGSEHILLVDDELPIVRVHQQILERLGYKSTVCTSSLEAMEMFAQSPERFDLILSDMTMPQMTGEKLARAAKEIRPGIPVILCTGFSERLNGREDALSIDAVLLKPIARRKMAETVRALLDRTQTPQR
jgi:PAS domain S-box-containing protein